MSVAEHRLTRGIVLALLGTGLAGCAAAPRRVAARPCCLDVKPVVHRQSIGWHLFDVTVLEPIEQPFHLLRFGRQLLGWPIRARNLRGGIVEFSAFFTNRDPAALTPEAVRWGPTRPEDAPQPPFLITRPKLEGKTPGFFVRDARGVRYLFKLDPVDAPELLSGAEVVTSKLMFALGYHVPSYEVAFVRPEDLHLREVFVAEDARGRTRPFRDAELRAEVAPRVHEGTVRVCATKILDGQILGPARFKAFRDCAEIRALKVAYTWVNNIDSKDQNSLLVWDGQQTVGYIFDFGTSLGADAGRAGPKTRCAGWTYLVDLKVLSLEALTLGWRRPACDPGPLGQSPHIGFFTAHVDPARWKPYAPNLAFNAMTDEDARWMARRLARLSTAQIEAAVSAGQYRDPADARDLVEMLEARRATILSRYAEVPTGGTD